MFLLQKRPATSQLKNSAAPADDILALTHRAQMLTRKPGLRRKILFGIAII